MERVRIGIISYGAREAAIVDAFSRSNYNVEFYIADKQRNPFNVKKAEETRGAHTVIPDLDVNEICKFFKKYQNKVDFIIPGCEGPIINGLRNVVEEETRIPVICPTKEYAIEKSKVAQRFLFQKVVPEVNPQFKVFDPKDYNGKSRDELKKYVYEWINELGGVEKSVIKPDKPGFGKGVGVGGEHFTTWEQAFGHFLSLYGDGREPVIIEEKIEGEESSFQAWCDGKHLEVLPDTRDHKRRFDGDKGENTGGMGSFCDAKPWLPFMTKADWEKEIEIVNKVFAHLRGNGYNSGLIGMPFYVAFAHTAKEPKGFEINSRPGDPEIINIMPIMKNDFVEVCYRILEGNLPRLELEPLATVVTYKVPPHYPEKKKATETRIDLTEAYKLKEKHGDKIRIYTGSAELDMDGKTIHALSSRVVGVVGIAETISAAREISLEGIRAIKGPYDLDYRKDIGSQEYIDKTIKHMQKLRAIIF